MKFFPCDTCTDLTVDGVRVCPPHVTEGGQCDSDFLIWTQLAFKWLNAECHTVILSQYNFAQVYDKPTCHYVVTSSRNLTISGVIKS